MNENYKCCTRCGELKMLQCFPTYYSYRWGDTYRRKYCKVCKDIPKTKSKMVNCSYTLKDRYLDKMTKFWVTIDGTDWIIDENLNDETAGYLIKEGFGPLLFELSGSDEKIRVNKPQNR